MDGINEASKKILSAKLVAYDTMKARWDALTKRGEQYMPFNSEMADAYFAAALDMEPELLQRYSELYRFKQAILRAKNSPK